MIYENGVRKYLLTEEGYVSLSDGIYHYFYRDHLGNVRLVMGTPTSSGGQVEERNDYYPFGGLIADLGSVQPYKYNGKELDTKKGLNWYDYGARQYDAALGIFTTVDPSSEKYYPTSPYVYCGGDPINRIDPTGADWYKDSDGNYHWAERGGDIAEGWTWVGSSVSIEISKSKYVNYYENGGIVANKPVNAFDLIASSPKLQNLFLGENSLLSEASKSRLLNGLVSRGTDAIARPIGEFLVWSGAGELGGPLVGQIFGWGAKGLTKLLGKFAERFAIQEYTYTQTVTNHFLDIVKKGPYKGELSRPFLNSPLTIQEIMKTGKGIPDATFKGGFNWKVPGTFRESQGVWELGINPKTKVIYHFDFVN